MGRKSTFKELSNAEKALLNIMAQKGKKHTADVATLIQLLLTGNSMVLFTICFWVNLITSIEIIAIIVTLKRWTNDVPTIYHAIQLKLGKAIKRYNLFNG